MGKAKLKRNVLKMVEKVAKLEMEKNNYEWRFCTGIFHQPKRPKPINKKEK